MKKIIQGKMLVAAICVILSIAPLLTYVNIMESGKHTLKVSFHNAGTKLLQVNPQNTSVSFDSLQKLSDEIPQIVDIIPISMRTIQISSYKSDSMVTLKAVGSSYGRYAGLKLLKGDFFSSGHVSSAANVAVVDDLTADHLFGTTNAIGRSIELMLGGEKREVTIVGVCKRLDTSEGKLEQSNGIAFVPITLFQNGVEQYELNKILLAVKGLHVEEAKAMIVHGLMQNGAAIEKEAIAYVEQVELLNSFSTQYGTILIAVAVICLLAAMIALNNVLLIDIEQNRNYYGLLKFYGSSNPMIRRKVYMRTFEIAPFCSILCITVAVLTSTIIVWMLNLPFYISIHTLTIGTLLPFIMCMAASLYPAVSASKIDANHTLWHVN